MPLRIVQAPAKLNLSLRVLGRRGGGYHNIASLVTPIDLCDTIRIRELPFRPDETPAGGGSITPGGTPIGPPVVVCRCEGIEGPNLAARAAELAGISAEISISKRIPVGAGLGGGSSDAAAVLRAFRREKSIDLAERLGADVPACLAGRPVWASGIGDVVTAVEAGDLPDFSLVLVWPHDRALGTAELYRALDDERNGRATAPPSAADELERDAADVPVVRFERSFDRLAAHVTNDFEALATQRVPEIARALRALADAGAAAGTITGKGPAAFGLFASDAEAVRAAQRVRTALGCTFTCVSSKPLL